MVTTYEGKLGRRASQAWRRRRAAGDNGSAVSPEHAWGLKPRRWKQA